MISKISYLFTELSADEALTLIQFLDQLRAAVLTSYAPNINDLMQQRAAEFESSHPPFEKEEPF